MKVGHRFEFPPDKQRSLDESSRHSWISIVLLSIAAVFMGLTTGQSQAMKTAWIGDIIAILPPVALLVAMRLERRPPSERYPFGYFRAVSIAFLVSAMTLLALGGYLLVDAILKLVHAHRPAIGSVVIGGHQIWFGWLMIAALAFSAAVGFGLGRIKRHSAEKLHAKAIFADIENNKGDWRFEASAIVGLVLVGYGWWWGDAVAAMLISMEILYDGVQNLRQVIADLMDEAPSKLGAHELEPLPSRLREVAEGEDWIEKAGVRLREHGHVLIGDVYVVPRQPTEDLVGRIDEVSQKLHDVDWRLYDLTITPVERLDEAVPPRVNAEA